MSEEDALNEFLKNFNKFHEYDENAIFLGQKLYERLRGDEDAKSLCGFPNGAIVPNTIFVLYVWDKVRKKHFVGEENDMSTRTNYWDVCVKDLVRIFTTIGHDEIDFNEFSVLVNEMQDMSFTEMAKCNWYDLPAILRVIAPSNEKFFETSFEDGKDWYASTLQGLPTQLIKVMWVDIASKVPQLKTDASLVSSKF